MGGNGSPEKVEKEVIEIGEEHPKSNDRVDIPQSVIQNESIRFRIQNLTKIR